MNELSPEQYQAVKEFSDGLTEVFTNYKNNHPDKFADLVINYVIAIIDIHLKLAELDEERYINNFEKAQNK